MRIQFEADSDKKPGQFVVYADNAKDREILREFVSTDRSEYTFWMHGYCGTFPYDGPSSFNFGWIKNEQDDTIKLKEANIKKFILEALRDAFRDDGQ